LGHDPTYLGEIMRDPKENDAKMPDFLSEYMVMTLNKKGPVTTFIDQYANEFIDYASLENEPVLELAAAYGFVTIEALKKGAKVIANDMDSQHLQILYNQTPKNYRAQLTLLPGKMPEEVKLTENSIAGCYVARMLGYLEPLELQESLKRIYSWLMPNKKFIIVSGTPYCYYKFIKNIVPQYEQRVAQNHPWPGYFTDLKNWVDEAYRDRVPSWHNYLDGHVLKRELERVGFVVEKVEPFARQDLPEWAKGRGHDAVFVRARKP